MARIVPVVAIHGNGGGRTRFSLVPALPEPFVLDPIDLPGFGQRPLDPSLDSVAAYADHLAERLAEIGAGADETPLVLGHGIGGSIALDLASRRPETMAGLILHAPVAADLDTRLIPRVMSTTPVREAARRIIASPASRPVLRRLFFDRNADREAVDAFFDGYRRCPAFGLMFDIIDAEWFRALEPVADVPTVLLWGDGDRVLKAGQTQPLQAKVPDAEVRIEPDWDHFPMIDQPEEYSRAIAEIAADLVARSAGRS